MSVDPAFKAAGKKEGLEIFRIEKLKVVQITDTKKFGKFHRGDSYICLLTQKVETALRWDIHFWLGSETSQDEAGVAAYKTVELDDSLGGAPVQHREVEAHESQQFEKIFKDYGGLQYLEGGVDSGFKKVDRDAYEKRLLHIKGKRNVRVSGVPVTYKSLNKGDCFVLDCGMKIYQWNGVKASRTERAKALDVTRDIRNNERGGRAQVIIIENGTDDESAFFADLGDSGAIAEAKDDDADFEKKKAANLKLYRVSDASGSVKVTEAGAAPLAKSMLDTNDAFIVDTAQSLFVWVGKKATKEEKNSAWTLALGFIKEKGYPVQTPVTRVIEGGETMLFIQQFKDWPQPQASINARGGNVAKVAKKAVDVNKMHAAGVREKQSLVDDGSGKLEIWRIENFEKVPVEKSMYGQFYMGDSYILLYTYNDKQGKEAYIIYFWQGNDSSQDEKGASAALATALDQEMGDAPVQVRVVQNKEPDHFLALFKGKFIIHKGGKGSGFKNVDQADEYDTDGTRLFHVKGTSELNTKATQVEEVASALNSNDCFVFNTPKQDYIWLGKYASGDERAASRSIAEVICKNAESVAEGSEKPEFWEALGGKADYPNAIRDSETLGEPRLFEISNASGTLDVEELFDYSQEDLIPDEVYLLDTTTEVYLWIGNGANAEEKKGSLEAAISFIKNSPDGRTPEDTPILTVKQAFEPTLFTCHFVWDFEKAKAGVSDYEKMKAELQAGGGAGVQDAASMLATFSATYDYDTLLKRPLPEGVDPANLVSHLEESAFPDVFKMDKAAFDALPGWKQSNLKKTAKLF